jgi:hypothetical protein
VLSGEAAARHRGRGAGAPAVGLRALSARDSARDRRRRRQPLRRPCRRRTRASHVSPTGACRGNTTGAHTPSTRPRSLMAPVSSRRRPTRKSHTPAFRRPSRCDTATAGFPATNADGGRLVTHPARIPRPKRASVGVRPENVTPVGQDRAGTRDMPDPRCYFVTHPARIPRPKRASIGVRPENVTRARRDCAGSPLGTPT